MDQNRIGLCRLKLFTFLLISETLAIVLATERCRNCLDGECKGSGECTKGCIVGFADKYCQHKCQPTCKDSNCQLDENTGKIICLYGCEDGFCRQRCRVPCVDGCLNCDYSTCTCPRCSLGICQHSCLDRCSLCDNGQCLFCRDGWHGRNCSQKCGRRCIRCNQKTGKCIKCHQGFIGDSCLEISTDSSDSNSTLTIAIVTPFVITVWSCVIAFMMMKGGISKNRGRERGISKNRGRERGIGKNRRRERDVPHDSKTSPVADKPLLGDAALSNNSLTRSLCTVDVNPTSQAQCKDCEEEDTIV